MRALCLLVTLGYALPASAAAKHYLIIRGVEEAPGVKCDVTPALRALFESELKKHPEFVVLPDEAALAAAQSQHKYPAIEVSLRVLESGGDLQPPPPGKQYRVLERRIRLSVFGNTLPDKKLAIGGDGDAKMQSEIGKQANVEKEGNALLLDCAKEAITQAVNMTATKLKIQAKNPKLKKK